MKSGNIKSVKSGSVKCVKRGSATGGSAKSANIFEIVESPVMRRHRLMVRHIESWGPTVDVDRLVHLRLVLSIF